MLKMSMSHVTFRKLLPIVDCRPIVDMLSKLSVLFLRLVILSLILLNRLISYLTRCEMQIIWIIFHLAWFGIQFQFSKNPISNVNSPIKILFETQQSYDKNLFYGDIQINYENHFRYFNSLYSSYERLLIAMAWS